VPPPAAAQDRSVFVAMGGDETLNRGLDDSLRRAWTQQIFGTALGPQAVYVNLASTDATVRDGLDEQLPKAVPLRPTLVTIWFGDGDAQVGTTNPTFSRDLTDIVTQLHAAGVAKVLLLSRTDPAAGNDSQYGEQIRQVASATGSEFVEITGPRNLRDPAAQQAIANAVTAHLGN
jgi:lysophospholipase L1-like esterase